MKTIALFLLTTALFAQQPQIENAKVQKVASSGSLAAQLADLGAGPFWAGYAEPIDSNRHSYMCGSNQFSEAPLRLEGQTAVVILVRMTNGHVDERRITSPDCRLDAGALPFFWIENVPVAESIAWLKTDLTSSSLLGISMHAGPLATDTLINAARSDRDPKVRSRALFWLAQKASNQQSLDTIRNAVTADPELAVKEQAVFALKQLPNDQGTPALIEVAKTHRDPAVRKKAMFWLGQSKDPRALDFFAQLLKP